MKQSPLAQALLFLTHFQLDEAEKVFEEMNTVQKQTTVYGFWWAFLKWLQQDDEASKATFAKMSPSFDGLLSISLIDISTASSLFYEALYTFFLLSSDWFFASVKIEDQGVKSECKQWEETCFQLGKQALSIDSRWAKRCFETLLKHSPKHYPSLLLLGHIYLSEGNTNKALNAYKEAYHCFPKSWVYAQIGKLYHTRGELEKARDVFSRVIDEVPILDGFIPLFVAPILSGEEDLLLLAQKVVESLPEDSSLQLEQMSSENHLALIDTLFDWYYHMPQTRSLRTRYAQCFHTFNYPLPEPVKNRLGMIVTPGHEGAFLHSMRGLIHHLPSSIEQVIFCDLNKVELFKQYLNLSQLRFLALPKTLNKARQEIHSMGCEWLYFWEVGTDPFNFFLSHFRMASIQFTSWGTPGTTGLPCMDYFLSCQSLEPEFGQENYSEQLLKTETLPAFYIDPYREDIPQKTLADFGLNAEAHIYLCPHNIQKISPDFDRVFESIADKDPQACFVLLAHQIDAWNENLLSRFKKTLSQPERVILLPRMKRVDFLSLIRSAHLVLDTWYFGAGKLAFECLGLGQLMISWPGPSMRGRIVSGCYQQMDLPHLISDTQNAYIEDALYYMNNEDARESAKKAIYKERFKIIETPEAAQDFYKQLQIMRNVNFSKY